MVIPVHATVRMFELSISPQLTITGGRGAMSAPPFHLIFAISLFPFYFILKSLYRVVLAPAEVAPYSVYLAEIYEGVGIFARELYQLVHLIYVYDGDDH